jgi:outer membrane protein assembly factor BamD
VLWPFGSSDAKDVEIEDQSTNSPSESSDETLQELVPKDSLQNISDIEDSSNFPQLRSIKILEKAQNYFARELFSLAREKFEILNQIEPSTTYKELTDIKLADCDLYSGEYEAAANGYSSFVDAHPSSPLVPYALFQAGQALRISDPGPGRDPSVLYRAQNFFSRLVRSYPQSNYSRMALAQFVLAEEELKEHRKKIINFYDNLELENALKARLNKTYIEEQESSLSIAEMEKLLTNHKAPLLRP